MAILSLAIFLYNFPDFAIETSPVSSETINVKQSEIIAMGDNYNDIDMLEYAGIGIAMGNAPEEVKKHGDDVTLTNDEDGVAIALEKYLVI